MSDRPSQILSYWRAVELFSPQSIPKLKPRDEQAPVFEPRFEGEPLPWQAGHVLQNRNIKDTESWTHTVYAGLFKLDQMRDLVEGEMGPPEESFEPRPRGESCLCSFSVTGAGHAIAESLVVSSGAWAVGRTLDPGFRSKGWLAGFESFAGDLSATFDRKMEVHEQTLELPVPKKVGGRWRIEKKELTGTIGTKTVDQDLLARLIRWVAKNLNAESLIDGVRWRVQSRLISNTKYFEIPSTDMLNSFFHEELGALSGRAESGSLGPCLETFLGTEIETDQRKDLVQRPDQMLELLDPEKFPKGRWPIVGKFPLVAGQQAAVSSAMESLCHGQGLFSVNGPPGTGKTTLLRDLIVAVIVERADQLAKLGQPGRAFEEEKESWKSPDRTFEVHQWKPDLVGFEMVIASDVRHLKRDGLQRLDGSCSGRAKTPGASSERVDPCCGSRIRGALDS